ncbi:9825_t:CDS:1, partial [Racocetra persica]
NSRKAYEDLYNPNNLTNPNSNTFLALIIQYIFVSKDEQTYINAIWTQAILKIIFDKHYLFAKIDFEVIDIWFQKLLNENNM